MIPFASNRFIGNNGSKFYIKPSLYKNEWSYYYKQYITAYDYLIGIANNKQYQMNCQFMSFMFIFRQSVELMLKYQLSTINQVIPLTHSLSKLAEGLDERFIRLVNNTPKLYPDSDGSQFRYYNSNDGTPYFHHSEILKVANDCNTFINFANNDCPIVHIKNSINPRDKVIDHELCFYTSECRGLGFVRSHYDMTLDCLTLAIINGGLDANDIYLPILFLIRHGIELAIKSNLLDLGNSLSEKGQRALVNEHNVFQLFKLLSENIEGAINSIPKDDKFRTEAERYKTKVIELKDLIHKFDAKSDIFRYPGGKNLKFKEDVILTALKLYYETDAFLTNAVLVLFEAGYLEIGDDVIYQYYYQ